MTAFIILGVASLSNYLSGGVSRSRTMKTAGSSHFPVIKRYTPYAPQTSRATSSTPISAPYSSQDLAAALLQQQQNRQATTPSSTYQDTYNYDPVQTQIQALGAQSVANAQTNAAQIRKSSAINEGDPDLLRSLGFDQNTIDAASNNPNSLFAQLNTDHLNRQRQLADAMQAQNLYYSGENQKQIALQAQGYAAGQGQIGQNLRNLLTGADNGVLSAQDTANQQALQEQLAAQQNAQINSLYQQLLEALMNGSGATSNTSTAPPPPPSTYDPNATYGPLNPAPTAPGAIFNPLPGLVGNTGQPVLDPNLTYDPVTGQIVPKPNLRYY